MYIALSCLRMPGRGAGSKNPPRKPQERKFPELPPKYRYVHMCTESVPLPELPPKSSGTCVPLPTPKERRFMYLTTECRGTEFEKKTTLRYIDYPQERKFPEIPPRYR